MDGTQGSRPPGNPRRRMTTRSLMSLVISVAIFLGFQVALRDHVRRWEARRAQMNIQRDLTGAVLREALADPATLNREDPGTSDVIQGPSTGTRVWSIEIKRRGADGKLGPALARVSGGNGEFALKPIIVEVDAPSARGPWLERLLDTYREKGWACEVVQAGE